MIAEAAKMAGVAVQVEVVLQVQAEASDFNMVQASRSKPRASSAEALRQVRGGKRSHIEGRGGSPFCTETANAAKGESD